MKQYSVWGRKSFLAAVTILILGVLGKAGAVTGTWTGATDSDWSTAGNWSGNVVPGATSGTTNADTALFNSGSGTIIVDSSLNIKSITFDGGVGDLSIGTIGGTNGLTLTSGGTIALGSSGTSVTNSNVTETINAPLILAGTGTAAYTFTNKSTDPTDFLLFTGPITGIGGAATTLVLSGTSSPTLANSGVNVISGSISDGVGTSIGLNMNAGIWTLSGDNHNMSGGVAIGRGILNVNNGTALGSGVFTINNSASFDNTSGGAVTVTGISGLNIAGSFSFGGSNNLNLGTANVTMTRSTWTINGTGVLTIGGNIISGAGTSATTKAGVGTLALAGDNSAYGLGFVLAQGTLDINSATALGSGSLLINGVSTIDNTSGGDIAMTQNNVQTWSSNFTFAGTHSLNMGSGAVTLGTGVTVTVGANTLAAGNLTGAGFALTKTGNGTLALGGVSGLGVVTVNGGTLSLGAVTSAGNLSVTNGSLIFNSSIGSGTYGTTTVGAGGALRAGADNAFYVTSGITLNGGTIGFVSGGNYSAGSASAAGLGVLKLTANSFLDFGGGNDLLHFTDSHGQWGSSTIFSLSIYDWDPANDALYFGASSNGLDASQLSKILFYSDNGATLISSGATINSLGQISMNAVPEPSPWALLGCGVFGLFAMARRRRLRLG